MKKSILIILFFVSTTTSLYSQDIDCNAISKKKLDLDNPNSIIDGIKTLKSCGLDNVDIKLFSQGPILGSLIMLITSSHKNKALTWGDLIEEINYFKKNKNYQTMRNNVISLNSVSSKLPGKKESENNIFAGVDVVTDYNSGLALSKKNHKPVLIYFNGKFATMCRKLENEANTDANLIKCLKSFIVISLLVDDQTVLDKPYRAKTGQLIKTIGGKNGDLEISKFNSNSQPLLAVINLNGDIEIVLDGYGNKADLQNFLINGKTRWDKKN